RSKGKGTHRPRPEWLRRKMKRFIAADPWCYVCGIEVKQSGDPYAPDYGTIDHVVPYSVDPSRHMDVSNWRVCCRRDNLAMNDKRGRKEPGVPMDEPRRGWADEQRGRVVVSNLYPEPTPEDLERVAGEPFMNLPLDTRTPREKYMVRWSRTWF